MSDPTPLDLARAYLIAIGRRGGTGCSLRKREHLVRARAARAAKKQQAKESRHE